MGTQEYSCRYFIGVIPNLIDQAMRFNALVLLSLTRTLRVLTAIIMRLNYVEYCVIQAHDYGNPS